MLYSSDEKNIKADDRDFYIEAYNVFKKLEKNDLAESAAKKAIHAFSKSDVSWTTIAVFFDVADIAFSIGDTDSVEEIMDRVADCLGQDISIGGAAFFEGDDDCSDPDDIFTFAQKLKEYGIFCYPADFDVLLDESIAILEETLREEGLKEEKASTFNTLLEKIKALK